MLGLSPYYSDDTLYYFCIFLLVSKMSVTFNRKLRKWGGSLVCAFPDEVLNALNLKELDEVALSVVNGVIVIRNPLVKEETSNEYVRLVLPSGSRLMNESVDLKIADGVWCFLPKDALTIPANMAALGSKS